LFLIVHLYILFCIVSKAFFNCKKKTKRNQYGKISSPFWNLLWSSCFFSFFSD